MEVSITAVHLMIDRHPQTHVGIAAYERLAQISRRHDGAQVEVADQRGHLVDETLLRRMALQWFSRIQPSMCLYVRQFDSTFFASRGSRVV